MSQEKLNLRALVAISSGGAVSSIVTTVMLATAQTGRSAWISYLIAIVIGGIIRSLPILVFANMFRYKGGNYTLVTKSLGEIMGGIYALWWLPMFFSRGMAASAIGGYIQSVFPSVNANYAGIFFATLTFIINLYGIHAMVNVQKKLTLAAAVALMVYVVVGFTKLDGAAFAIGDPSYYLNGGVGIVIAVTLVIQGAAAPSLVSGFSWEAENPKKNVPRAILLSNLVLIAVCCLVSFVASNITGGPELYGQPLTYSAEKILPGMLFSLFMLIGPFMTLFVALNSGMSSMAAPVVAAIGNGWLPESIGKTNKHGVPWIIYGTMWIICIAPLIFGVSLSVITAYTVIAQRISGMLLWISAFRYPTIYKDNWEKSGFYMNNTLYYLTLVFIAAVEIATLVLSISSVGVGVFVGNLVLVAMLAAYAVVRYKQGKVHSDILIEE